ncbi:hypothetical protein BC937DRAFT_95023 [Endogone sp. FLAS-F59071]|nr:hypothetical protein BC937DRAFT_95023 [Endogone sp. FLAS-F59071]|eukprot:RUS13628.1 hypothetical protein BC937DRAFT_95023 [Endogone sp. FLAS-F59071]
MENIIIMLNDLKACFKEGFDRIQARFISDMPQKPVKDDHTTYTEWNKILNEYQKSIDKFSEFVEWVINKLMDWVKDLFQKIYEIFNNLWKWIQAIVQNIVERVQTFINQVSETIGSLYKFLFG